jgi:hypothetical protein
MTTLPLLGVLALAVRMTRDHILLVTGRSNSAWSRCPLMGSSSALASWLLRGRIPHPPSRISFLPGLESIIRNGKGTYYVKDTGGIITVRPELGEPIHKVNNRALRIWKEYDDTVFKLPREKRVAWLQERRAEVIQRLNADYFKPWFPAKKDGRVVEDLGDMTYEETVLRLVRLMYVTHEDRWLNLSLRNLAGDWLRRIEERFAGMNGSGPKLPNCNLIAASTSHPRSLPVSSKSILSRRSRSWCMRISHTSLTSRSARAKSPHHSSQFWITTLKSGSRRYSLCVWCSNTVQLTHLS